jgi:hypothetical protein
MGLMDQKSNGWLLAARVGWMVIFLLTVVMTIVGIAPYSQSLQTICTQDEVVCFNQNRLTPQTAQEAAQAGVSLRFYAGYYLVTDVLIKLVWIVIGLILFVRRSDDWMALLVSIFLITFGPVTFSSFVVDSASATYPVLTFPARLLNVIGDMGIVAFFLLFPGGRFLHRWMAGFWVLAAALAIAEQFFAGYWFNRDTWPEYLSSAYFFTLLGICIYAQIYRYRNISNTVQRYQTRWVVFGTVTALSGLTFVALLLLILQVWDLPVYRMAGDFLISLLMTLIPLSIAVAVLRYRLWDIGFIIRRTLLYGALTVISVALYLGTVVLLQAIFRQVTGSDSQAGIVVSTLIIAILFNPLRRRLQDWIDRRFYRQKVDADKMLIYFTTMLRHEVDPDQITGDLLAVVEETLQPEQVTLWIRKPA